MSSFVCRLAGLLVGIGARRHGQGMALDAPLEFAKYMCIRREERKAREVLKEGRTFDTSSGNNSAGAHGWFENFQTMLNSN
jgi:hypothetical protein